MRPGDRIAIKASFVKKHGLPFENHGHGVSTMRIKARGWITRISDMSLEANWEPLDPPKEWYFYTHRSTIWHLGSNEYSQRLARFVFDDEEQEIERFLEDPFWAKRYAGEEGESGREEPERFSWIPFYEAFANSLLDWREHRLDLTELVAKVRANHGLSTWTDKFSDGSVGPLADIDPVTAMSVFNLGPTPNAKRQAIAQALADGLGLDDQAPENFAGIPTSHPQKAWLFRWEKSRADTIELIWDVFEAALAWADTSESAVEHDRRRESFRSALGPALASTNWQLLTGLYRARPDSFFPMDGNTHSFITTLLGTGHRPPYDSEEAVDWYLETLDRLFEYMSGDDPVANSIPEVSDLARSGLTGSESNSDSSPSEGDEGNGEVAQPTTYTLDDLISDGCFVPREELEQMLMVLRRNLNLILQGAPGIGKTWLAKRLGWVLAGSTSSDHTQVVQFHPNTSYEDFVRGYRPKAGTDGTARLSLVDGPFLRLADTAHAGPDQSFT